MKDSVRRSGIRKKSSSERRKIKGIERAWKKEAVEMIITSMQ